MVTTRARKQSQEKSSNSRAAAALLGQHAPNDAAVLHGANNTASASRTPASTQETRPSIITWGRIIVFLVFPLTVGVLGVAMAFLNQKRFQREGNGQEFRDVSLHQDFIMPFLLALTMSIVVSIQSSGLQKQQGAPTARHLLAPGQRHPENDGHSQKED
jgi:hypothetical protein